MHCIMQGFFFYYFLFFFYVDRSFHVPSSRVSKKMFVGACGPNTVTVRPDVDLVFWPGVVESLGDLYKDHVVLFFLFLFFYQKIINLIVWLALIKLQFSTCGL